MSTHLDFFGNPVVEGCKVIIPRSNTLRLCTVNKITPKMAHVIPVTSGKSKGYYVYTSDTVVVDSEDVLAYILKHAK